MLHYFSLIQGCSLGLDVSVSRRSRDLFSNVSVSKKSGKVSSRSRLGHETKCLGLGPQGLVYKSNILDYIIIIIIININAMVKNKEQVNKLESEAGEG